MGTTYRNIAIFFSLILVFVFAAFFKTYFGLFPDFKDTTLLVHTHVAVLLLWFAMLIVQPVLIGTKRLKLHRLVGKASYVLVPLVVISSVLMTRNQQMREKELAVFTVNIFDVSMFILFYTLAIIYKHKTAWHTRFMILTAIPFLGASSARFDFPGIVIQLTIMVGLLLLEFFKGKVFKPYVIALSSFMTMLILLAGLFFMKPDVLDSLWKVFF
jgi:hypothetical protein